MNGHASSLAAFCDHFSSSKQTFRRLGFRHSRQDLVKTSPANECPRKNIYSILSFSLLYSVFAERAFKSTNLCPHNSGKVTLGAVELLWDQIACEQAPSQVGRNSASEASGSQSVVTPRAKTALGSSRPP